MTDRADGRAPDALRPITIDVDAQPHAAGSVVIRWGGTHVLCAASFEPQVPPHRIGSGGGWLTAEYSMLPGSSSPRVRRERGAVGGRTAEIQRLIGRSLRAAVDLDALGPRTLRLDCDVLRADGGTRCASITGAWIAAGIALLRHPSAPTVAGAAAPTLAELPLSPVSAVSLGVVGGALLTDLCYREDVAAEVDLNFVATPAGIVEVQGTAEGRVFTAAQLAEMVRLGGVACEALFALQRRTLERVAAELAASRSLMGSAG